MNDTKYQPQTINEVVFGNDESRLIIEDIVSGVMPFPWHCLALAAAECDEKPSIAGAPGPLHTSDNSSRRIADVVN